MNDIQRRYPRLFRVGAVFAALSVCVVVLSGLMFGYAYHRYSRVVDRRIARDAAFAPRPRLRVVARPIRPGQPPVVLLGRPLRASRRLPTAEALPPHLVQAVVAIEDRRFFRHGGVDYLRTARCAVQDAVTFHAACGGSTLTQQLARTDFLTQDRTLKRKLVEMVIARRLEERLTKRQILTLYARQIDLGQNGSIAIHGFRQGARVYFGKDLNQLTLAQCALLAGMVHAPNFDNPLRHPDRAIHRRNVVLNAMVETGAITRAQAEIAKAEPLDLTGTLAPDPFADFGATAQG